MLSLLLVAFALQAVLGGRPKRSSINAWDCACDTKWDSYTFYGSTDYKGTGQWCFTQDGGWAYVKSGTHTWWQKTDDGGQCDTATLYGGVRTYGCTSQGWHRPWCYVDNGKNWKGCKRTCIHQKNIGRAEFGDMAGDYPLYVHLMTPQGAIFVVIMVVLVIAVVGLYFMYKRSPKWQPVVAESDELLAAA